MRNPELGLGMRSSRRGLSPLSFVSCAPEASHPSVPVWDSIPIGQLQFSQEDTEPWAHTVIAET